MKTGLKLDNLEFIKYTKTDGSQSERLVFELSESGNKTLVLDLTEFDDDAYRYAHELQLHSNAFVNSMESDPNAGDVFNEAIKGLGLSKQYRNLITSRIEYV